MAVAGSPKPWSEGSTPSSPAMFVVNKKPCLSGKRKILDQCSAEASARQRAEHFGGPRYFYKCGHCGYYHLTKKPPQKVFSAPLAEQADAAVSKAAAFGHVGSTPTGRTRNLAQLAERQTRQT